MSWLILIRSKWFYIFNNVYEIAREYLWCISYFCFSFYVGISHELRGGRPVKVCKNVDLVLLLKWNSRLRWGSTISYHSAHWIHNIIDASNTTRVWIWVYNIKKVLKTSRTFKSIWCIHLSVYHPKYATYTSIRYSLIAQTIHLVNLYLLKIFIIIFETKGVLVIGQCT